MNPLNMLSKVQKEFFKKLHSWLLQDGHGLPHQLLAKAHLHEALKNDWSVQFKKFLFHVALGIIRSNLNILISFINFFYKKIILKIDLAEAFRRAAQFDPRRVRALRRGCRSRDLKKSFWASIKEYLSYTLPKYESLIRIPVFKKMSPKSRHKS